VSPCDLLLLPVLVCACLVLMLRLGVYVLAHGTMGTAPAACCLSVLHACMSCSSHQSLSSGNKGACVLLLLLLLLLRSGDVTPGRVTRHPSSTSSRWRAALHSVGQQQRVVAVVWGPGVWLALQRGGAAALPGGCGSSSGRSGGPDG
jgi:hypothetical protein